MMRHAAFLAGCFAWACAQLVGAAEKLPSDNLPNAFRVTDKVISGGQPNGEAAFKELRDLGVKTVVSVDGAVPAVELAKKYGLRYVHLPHGYDGIPADRAKELAKAVRDQPGPIYLHCHHGKHRSPAAAAAACIIAGTLSADDGLNLLKVAGTSPQYRGLFQSVESAKALKPAELDNLKVQFRETVALAPMAEAMIGVEHAHDHLKAIAAAGWKAPPKQPGLEPAHEALLLREHFTELLRTMEVKKQSPRFQELMRDSEQASGKLEDLLRDAKSTGEQRTAALEQVTKACADCHREFRDVPLDEKQKAGAR